MRNFLYTSLFVVAVSSLAGCKVEMDEPTNSDADDPIKFRETFGIQSDVKEQSVTVVNSDDEYNQFWLSLPSMSGTMPLYDSATEMLVGVTMSADPCAYFPVVTSVTESADGVTVQLTRKQLVQRADGGCESLKPQYAYDIAIFGKSDKPVTVTAEAPFPMQCDAPVGVYGRVHDLSSGTNQYIITLRAGADPQAFSDEYAEQYGEDFGPGGVMDTLGLVVAELSEEVLATLRCDERVTEVSFDSAVGTT